MLIDCSGSAELMFDLTGKLALVTGCRRGIGLAMAEALARAGADIVGVEPQPRGRRRATCAQRVEAARAHVRRRTAADLGDRDARPRASRARRSRDGRPVDILVNNAGTITRAPAVDHTDEMWDDGDRGRT